MIALACGCSGVPAGPEPVQSTEATDSENEDKVSDSRGKLARRADEERINALERQVERLKMDLVRAENTLVAVESRLKSSHSRATAVSSLAEAQIQLNRTSEAAPWRTQEVERVRSKLDIAQKHIDNEYFGAAMFFIYRANRIMEQLDYEAGLVESTPNTMFVSRPRVNLRAEPSIDHEVLAVLGQGTPVVRETREGRWILVHTLDGLVGWIHNSLIDGKVD